MHEKILVVDDVIRNIQVIAGHLDEENYDLTIAKSGMAALEAVGHEIPDLILLDINMPGITGFEVCKRLQSDPKTKKIPIIFLTARVDSEDLVKGFELGAVDYLTKPFNQAKLKARVKNHLELSRLRLELIEKNILLAKAATTDPLTGLYNRREIIDKLSEEKGRIDRGGKESTIILTEIDDFKKVNDNYGHDGGDFVLVEVSRRIEAITRNEDHIARWGGEEFLIFLPDTELAKGLILAEKIRSEIENYTFRFKEDSIPVTLTLGVSHLHKQNSIDDSITNADLAMYEGKNTGKNRVQEFKIK